DVPKHLKKILYDAGIEKAIKKQKAALGQLAANLEGGRARSEEGQAKAKKTPKQRKKEHQKKAPEKRAQQAKAPPKPKIDLDSAFKSTSPKEVINQDSLVGPTQTGNTAAALAKGGFSRGTKGQGAGGGGQSVGIGQLTGKS